MQYAIKEVWWNGFTHVPINPNLFQRRLLTCLPAFLPDMFGNGWKRLNLSCQAFEYRQRFVLNWDLFLSTTFAAIISFSPSSADNWKISFFQLPEMTVIKFLPKATNFFSPCAMIPPPIAVTPSSASGAQSQTYKETVQFCSLIKVIIWFGLWFPYRACFRVYSELCSSMF